MSAVDDDEKWAVMAVLEHLKQASKNPRMNADALMEATFAIASAYEINMHNAATKKRFPLNGLSLPAVYRAGREALLSGADAASKHAPTAPTPVISPSSAASSATAAAAAAQTDAGFDRFVTKLRDSTVFFDGAPTGSPEFAKRLAMARKKYDARRASKKQRTSATEAAEGSGGGSSAAAAQAVAMASASASVAREMPVDATSGSGRGSSDVASEKHAQAARIKERGNAEMKAKRYEAAQASYSECIALDDSNAVYFSNRAAARTLLARYSEAVDDCKRAIAIDATFVRPRERLAAAYRYLGMTRNEVEALRGAVAVDGGNETYRAMLRDAEARLAREEGDGGRAQGVNNGEALNSMARSIGFNLPDGVAETLANSGMMEQVGNMVRENPSMISQMMQMMGGMGGGGGGGSGGSGGATAGRGT